MERPGSRPQAQPQKRRRRRPALSCWECRRRKIKCDRNDPCAHCIRQNTECIFKLYASVDDDQAVSGTVAGAGTDTVVSPSQLPPGQVELPPPSTDAASLSVSKTSTNIRGHVTAPSSLRSTAQRPTEQLPRSSAAITPSRTDSTGGQPGSPSSLRKISRDLPAGSDSLISDLLKRIQKLESESSTVSRTDRGVESPSTPYSNHARSETENNWQDSLVHHAQLESHFQVDSREWQDVLNKPRDLGKSRRMGEAPDFAAIIACYSAIMGKESQTGEFQTNEPETAKLLAQAGECLLKCKSLAKRLKVGRPSRGLPSVYLSTSPEFGCQLSPPSREVADNLANLYFASFESTHRILHIPTFWIDYQRYWDHPETATNDLRLKVLLVIAIGSSLYDHADSGMALRNTEMVQPWIYAAETWLAGPLEKDRLDIGGIQIYCLTILARQIFSVGGDLVWMSMGSLIHRAMQIGLHREPKSPTRAVPSVLDAELRRRLWATILDLVVQASLDAWMPPRIYLEEFDTEPPSNINDDEMNESTLATSPHPRTTFTTTSLQLALLDSLPVRLRIVQLLNGLHLESSYTRILILSSELTDALRATSNLSILKTNVDTTQNHSEQSNNEEQAAPSTTPFHRSLLDYLVRRFMIPLHMFFSNQAHSNPLFHYSLKASLDAALAFISPEPNASGTFSKLMAIGGGLFREGLRCAMTAISQELLSHVSEQQQNGMLHRAPQHRDLLKRAVRDLLAISEARIRQGETNVKGYMFMSMVLAQVEAIEEGDSVGDGLARSAMESLRFCHEILKTRADGNDTVSFGVEGIGGATPGSMGFETYGMDWDWDREFFMHNNAGFS